MKVDVSKIDGYSEMSAEDKIKALEAFEFEAVYGRAIYVMSPYEEMYYSKNQVFDHGNNATYSDDENFGTTPSDAVSTLRRAYELINESTTDTVFDNAIVLCGRQYEVHRYYEKTGNVDNYDYKTLNSLYPSGTYQNYYYTTGTFNRINQTTGQVKNTKSGMLCVFGYNGSLYKPSTITSMQGQKNELVFYRFIFVLLIYF